jgi:hypothetical protein
LQFFSLDLSDTRELTVTEAENDSDTESVSSGTDHQSDSESELWEQFDFPQLTAEEDALLTIALQGNASQPTRTTSNETSTTTSHHEATVDYSSISSGVQAPTDQRAFESGPPVSPPPYNSEFGEGNTSQPVNGFFYINNNSIIPISSINLNRQSYIVIDGVYHVIRQL